MQKIKTLVLQSAEYCNLDCDYCYLPDRDGHRLMTDEVLRRISDEIIASRYWADDSLLLWNAGEPLTSGPEWYEKAQTILGASRPAGLRVQFQSNATLLSDAWIDFFRRTGAMIEVSLDGPEWLHDRHRKDRSGRGTFAKAMMGVDLLRKNGIPFTCIMTVTRDALPYADEVFEFFGRLRPERLSFGIEEAEGTHNESTLYDPGVQARVEHFFRRIAQCNFASTAPLRIREIENVLSDLVGPPGRASPSPETEHGRIVAVGLKGDVAFFSPELLTTQRPDGSRLVVGNLMTDGLEALTGADETRRQMASIENGVRLCRQDCGYFDFCGGGSPANKYFEHGRFDVSETWYCRVAKKAAVSGILKAILVSRYLPLLEGE